MEPKPKRRHHVNPRFYLRKFQIPDEEGFIWRYDNRSGDAKKLAIDKVAVQTDYYSFVNDDDLRDTETIEDFLANVEGVTAPIFAKVLTGEELSEDERMTFAYFVGISWLRAPATRRQTAEAMAAMVRTISRASAMDGERFRDSYRRMEEHNCTDEKDRLSDSGIEEIREFMLADEYGINIAQEVTLLQLGHLPEVAKIIFQMQWSFVLAPEGFRFITSDSPVVREIPPEQYHPMMGPGLMNPSIVVSFPCSPHLCWLGAWKEMPASAVISKEGAKAVNRLRAVHAERYLYSSVLDSGLSKLAKKYRDHGLKLRLSGFGFEGKLIDAGQFKSESKGIAPKSGGHHHGE